MVNRWNEISGVLGAFIENLDMHMLYVQQTSEISKYPSLSTSQFFFKENGFFFVSVSDKRYAIFTIFLFRVSFCLYLMIFHNIPPNVQEKTNKSIFLLTNILCKRMIMNCLSLFSTSRWNMSYSRYRLCHGIGSPSFKGKL